MLFLILLSFIWIFKVINCCISNGNPLKICGLDLFLNNCCFKLNSPPHSLTSSIFYWCSKLCVSFFAVISNIILFRRWKTLHLTDHQLRNCFKGNLSRCFFVFCFFFAKPTVATCVFWCTRGKKRGSNSCNIISGLYESWNMETEYEFLVEAKETQDSIFSIAKFRLAALK